MNKKFKMFNFTSIDFETANPKRVSACSFGYAEVFEGQIVNTKGYLIKPVGGHSSIQSEIHGIKHEDTHDKPDFDQLWPEIHDIFDSPLAGYSSFDQQVLNALSDHFNLGLDLDYTDVSLIVQKQLPHLRKWNLKTVAEYLGLPVFNHHDATEDAITCAKILLNFQESPRGIPTEP